MTSDRSGLVREWLLDSDPSIRWQVMQDVVGASPADVTFERARVATEGWGAQVLTLQRPDGTWGGTAWNRGWDSTMHALTLLREFGLDPAAEPARRALTNVRDRVTWKGSGPEECDANRYFEGEVEPCINGQVAAAAAYFGEDVRGIIDRLLTEQLEDGGWNCDTERGSTRASFNTTICVLEALLEHERRFGDDAALTAARARGEAYLLERQLMRRLSTGEVIESCRRSRAPFTLFAFPNWWHYDVLRALDYLRAAGVRDDRRTDAARDLVESRRQPDGRWLLDVRYPGTMLVKFGEAEGEPSRWITLRALRVLGA